MERMATEDTARILVSLEAVPLSELLQQATAMRRAGHGNVISYSRKVFIPLTQLCRDVCGYCTFATAPREVAHALSVARRRARYRPRRRATPAATRRCSRSATSRSCATTRRATRLKRLGYRQHRRLSRGDVRAGA